MGEDGEMAEPDRIGILVDQNSGVCDVVLYQGENESHLSQSAYDCKTRSAGVTETMLRLPEETPLVGFRGKVDEHGLVSLGLILVDTIDPICQIASSVADMSIYKGLTDSEKSKIAEDGISKAE